MVGKISHDPVGADAHIGLLRVVRIRRNISVIGTFYRGAMWASPPTAVCFVQSPNNNFPVCCVDTISRLYKTTRRTVSPCGFLYISP